jgi:hypothetical protein
MECEEPITGRPTGQILLDYLTDTVLTHKTGLFGHPHVSPNSRCVVTLDRGRDGVTLVVQEVVGELQVCFWRNDTVSSSDCRIFSGLERVWKEDCPVGQVPVSAAVTEVVHVLSLSHWQRSG